MNIFFKVEANPVEMRCQCLYSAVMANSKLDYYNKARRSKIVVGRTVARRATRGGGGGTPL